MTKGQLLLILTLTLIVGVIIGELAYRRRFRKMKRETNLSDFGIEESLDRCTYIFIGCGAVFVIEAVIGLVFVIIEQWNEAI